MATDWIIAVDELTGAALGGNLLFKPVERTRRQGVQIPQCLVGARFSMAAVGVYADTLSALAKRRSEVGIR